MRWNGSSLKNCGVVGVGGGGVGECVGSLVGGGHKLAFSCRNGAFEGVTGKERVHAFMLLGVRC